MNFTYKQPYVTWKGSSIGSAVPTWSRPLINNNTNTNTGTSFAARPIKQWRKQLVPAANTGISKNASMGMPMDRPGGSVYLGSAVYLGATVDCSNCPVNLTELIPTTKNTIFDNTKDSSYNCVACNPETNIIKSVVTLLNNNYTDTKAYLQSRCQTYEQKLSTMPIIGNSYINSTTHQPIPPSDSPTGSQVYYTENCSKKCATVNSVVRTIYKPNNQQYSQQGSVSSSSRLTRLKNNTITKNGNTFKTAWGQQGANAGRYQGTSDSDYFLKTKNQECVPFHRDGNKTTSCILPASLHVPICGIIDISTIATNTGGNNWSIIENKTIEICQILNINNGITLSINPDVTLTVKGIINNSGTINTSDVADQFYVAIINDGTINNNAGGIININTGTITNNADGTIKNNGTINILIIFTFSSYDAILNYGTINNNAGCTITVSNSFAIINNFGTIENNNGTITITFNSKIINNVGCIIYNNAGGVITLSRDPGSFPIIDNYGEIKNSGTIDNVGGIINNNAGGIINNNAGGIINNSLLGTGFSLIVNKSAGIINNNTGSIINNGRGNTLLNSAFINQTSGIIYNAGGTINNILTGFSIYNQGTIANSNSGTITNGGQINITITGSITNSSTITNNNQITNVGGTITNNAGGIITINSNSITNQGTMTNDIGGQINIASTGTIINSAGGNTLTNNGTITINSGSITNNGGGIIQNNKTITNNTGTITNNAVGIFNNNTGGTIINVGGTFRNVSSSIINNKVGGIITNKASGTINNSSTFIFAGGTINNNLGGIIYNNGGGTINNTVGSAGPAIINNNGSFNSPTIDIGCGIGIIIGIITGNPIVEACPP